MSRVRISPGLKEFFLFLGMKRGEGEGERKRVAGCWGLVYWNIVRW